MPAFAWKGERAPRGLLTTITRAGWTLGDDAAVCVVRTATLPTTPPRVRWVWLVADRPHREDLQRAVDLGAVDVVPMSSKGFETRLLARLAECLIEEPVVAAPPGFIAVSQASRALVRECFKAAQTSMPVLLTGETGTGKEVAAHLVHQWSTRNARTFVPINCAAIPNELMEGELFGYAKGAFSGAVRDYDGLVAAAEGGTVFLDEIDDTPFALQVKLLRVLEDHVISRLGENSWHRVDFRVLAATNRDLRPLIESGHFGGDLFERLATLQIELPPLRERLEDLPALTAQLIDRYYDEDKVAAARGRVRGVTGEALEILSGYRWPGNIRELRNVVFGALVRKRTGDELLASDLPRRLWTRADRVAGGVVSVEEIERRLDQGSMNLKGEIVTLERVALTSALKRARGNAAQAARLLGEVGHGSAKDPGGTVRTMMKRLKID